MNLFWNGQRHDPDYVGIVYSCPSFIDRCDSNALSVLPSLTSYYGLANQRVSKIGVMFYTYMVDCIVHPCNAGIPVCMVLGYQRGGVSV